MKKALGCALLLSVISSPTFAVPITLFMDTDTFIGRAKDIVLAECTSIPSQEAVGCGLRLVDVRILKVLKGGRRTGCLRIATIHAMEPHTTYMLYNLGGNALGTDFLALDELSVVPLPSTFKLDDLEGRDLKEQVQYLFSRRLFELECELAPLLKEKEVLERSVSDREYGWYESDGPVKIGPISETSTQTDETKQIWLDLEDKRLPWSQSFPGKSGYLYFEKMGASWAPYWEFSPCEATKIEDLAGKPLKARFYGMYAPGRRESALGWTGLQAIQVTVGRVLLARTVDDPQMIFAIQIESQMQDQEHVSARYTLIHQ